MDPFDARIALLHEDPAIQYLIPSHPHYITLAGVAEWYITWLRAWQGWQLYRASQTQRLGTGSRNTMKSGHMSHLASQLRTSIQV